MKQTTLQSLARLVLGGAVLAALTGCLVSPPDYSPDGHWLAFGVGPHGERSAAVHIYNASDESTFQIPLAENIHAYWPVWAPDGRRLAYLQRDTTWSVGLYDMRHYQAEVLYRAPQGAALGPHLAWSPHGNYLYANQRPKDGEYEVIRIDVRDGVADRIGMGLFGWPVDATDVLWLETRTSDVNLHVDPAARLRCGERVLPATGLNGTPYYPVLSHDRRKVACWTVRDVNANGRFDTGTDRLRLTVQPLNAAPAHLLEVTPSEVCWWAPVWNRSDTALAYWAPTSHEVFGAAVRLYHLREKSDRMLYNGPAAVVAHPRRPGVWAVSRIGRSGSEATAVLNNRGLREIHE